MAGADGGPVKECDSVLNSTTHSRRGCRVGCCETVGYLYCGVCSAEAECGFQTRGRFTLLKIVDFNSIRDTLRRMLDVFGITGLLGRCERSV